MISTSKQQSTTYTTNENTIGKRVVAAIRWPFTNRLTAPLWLALRLKGVQSHVCYNRRVLKQDAEEPTL